MKTSNNNTPAQKNKTVRKAIQVIKSHDYVMLTSIFGISTIWVTSLLTLMA